jgi:chemotaxis protein CheD
VHFVQPGEVFVLKETGIISTILGSCVAVCLWDAQARVAGMNHITLPICRRDEITSTRFANVATYVLYDLVRESGAQPAALTARVFGGANGISGTGQSPGLSVGSRNAAITFRILKKLGVRIVGHDVSGHEGRKVQMNATTGKVRMSYLQSYDFSEEGALVLKGPRR